MVWLMITYDLVLLALGAFDSWPGIQSSHQGVWVGMIEMTEHEHNWELVSSRFAGPDPDDLTRTYTFECTLCGKKFSQVVRSAN